MRTYHFGDWTLDTGNRVLAVSGRPVQLEPQQYRCLLYLVEHSDRSVTTEELIRSAWQGANVEPASVHSAIHAIRKAMGHSTRNSPIEARNQHGYRFVGHVTFTEGAHPPRDRLGWRFYAGRALERVSAAEAQAEADAMLAAEGERFGG